MAPPVMRFPVVRVVQATALAAVAMWAALLLLGDDAAPEPQPVAATWAYIIDEQDIEQVTFQSSDAQTLYRKVFNGWVFEDTGGPVPVNAQRWHTEVLVLLGGPAANRVLTVSDAELAAYGLAPPQFEIEMALRGGRVLRVSIGTTTPDSVNRYIRVNDRSEVSLVPASWGDFLSTQFQ